MVERIWTEGAWTEESGVDRARRFWPSGPISVPNDRMLSWDPVSGAISVFREPSNGANGNSTDREGRLVTCEQAAQSRHANRARWNDHGARGPRRRPALHRLPTTSSAKSDGTIWFTDPDYGRGLIPDTKGSRRSPALPHLHRLEPGSGSVSAATFGHGDAERQGLLPRRADALRDLTPGRS